MGGRELLDFDYVEWDDTGDLQGNLEHIAAAGLTPEEVEEVLYAPDPDADTSDETGRPVVFGTTSPASTSSWSMIGPRRIMWSSSGP